MATHPYCGPGQLTILSLGAFQITNLFQFLVTPYLWTPLRGHQIQGKVMFVFKTSHLSEQTIYLDTTSQFCSTNHKLRISVKTIEKSHLKWDATLKFVTNSRQIRSTYYVAPGPSSIWNDKWIWWKIVNFKKSQYFHKR